MSTPRDLQQEPWYWKSVSRDTIDQHMSQQKDGTWLVRDSTTSLGQYTLVLRHQQCNKMIKIYQCDQKFALAPNDQLQFHTITELVERFQHNSLLPYNRALNLKLGAPLIRPVTNLDSESMESLIERLKLLHAKYLMLSASYDDKFNDHQRRLQHVNEKLLAVTNFEHTIKVFRDHMELAQRMQQSVQAFEQRRWEENRSAMQRKLDDLIKSKEILEAEIVNSSEPIRRSEADTTKLKQRLLHCLYQRREHQDALSLKGLDAAVMETLLTEVSDHPERYCDQNNALIDDDLDDPMEHVASGASKSTSPIPSSYVDVEAPFSLPQTQWLVDWPRQKCHESLTGKATGTFLIRPSSQKNRYALSVMCDDVIHHCLIDSEKGRFGFGGKLEFDSLQELVQYYATHSLANNNTQLKTTLKFPILAAAPPD